MLLLRSLLFQTWFFASVIVFAIAVVLCWPLPISARFAVARGWGRGMLWAGRFFCGLDYVIEGTANIPETPAVIMSKHSTVFEAYAQLVFFPSQSWVVKRELLWVPLFGWGLAALRPIAIDRSAGRNAVRQVIGQGKQRLAEGLCVTIFPEGTRVAPGTTRKYGVSGAALAQEAGVPIVPVAHNAGDFWPRRSVIKRPGLIRLCIGPPILPGTTPPRDLNLTVQTWIETKMREISTAYGSGRSPETHT
jgi:1-acyl-sn-glycerol-3-phosphate acyltransferase